MHRTRPTTLGQVLQDLLAQVLLEPATTIAPLLVAAVAVGGCSLALDTGSLHPRDDDGGLPDSALLQFPELFPDQSIGGQPARGLLEGSGSRTSGTGEGSTAEPIPIYLAQLSPDDEVMVTVPKEFSESWQVCGSEVAPGESVLVTTPAVPCARNSTSLALALVIPVDVDVQEGDTVSDLRIDVVGLERERAIELPVFALDELVGTPRRVDGLYSKITIDEDYEPVKTASAISFKSVSDMEILARLDASGSDGKGDVFCSKNGGCGGGFGGPGTPSGGAGNGASSSSECRLTSCDAITERGGHGGTVCADQTCNDQQMGAGGGGGANAGNGGAGEDASFACGSGGAGGSSPNADPMLVFPDMAWGGGGGAGGAITIDSGSPTYDGAGGGGGGGVIDLVALGTLRVGTNGALMAKGGNGGAVAKDGLDCSATKTFGRGGGGAGGAIRLRAGAIESVETLAASINISGGLPDGGADRGRGSVGRARLDGASGDEGAGSFPLGVRGPDFSRVSPIVVEQPLTLHIHGNDAAGDGNVSYAYRAFTSTRYEVVTTAAPENTVTVQVPLEPGLNEVCVLIEARASGDVGLFEDGVKRCTWVAYVPKEGA